MRIALFTLALVWPSFALGEVFTSVAAAKDVTDKIMAKVGAGDLESGLKMLKPYTIVPPAEFDAMAGQAMLQMPMITQRFGKALGSEFVREDKAGTSVARLAYISKHEKHVMRWQFYLYKTPQGWVINTFNFDDKIQELF